MKKLNKSEIAKITAFVRMVRVGLAMAPALIAQLLEAVQVLPFDLPTWVVPTLTALGIAATGFDKFIREVSKYSDPS